MPRSAGGVDGSLPGGGAAPKDFRTGNHAISNARLSSTKNARVATLVICLVLLASLLGALNTALIAPFSQGAHKLPLPSSAATTTNTPGTNRGRILVNASLGIDGFPAVAIPNA